MGDPRGGLVARCGYGCGDRGRRAQGCDNRRCSSGCAMATEAAGLQGCGTLLAATREVLSPDKLSAGRGSGWMGGAEEPPETKQTGCLRASEL